MNAKWVRDGDGNYDLTTESGRVLGSIYRGGKSGYRWTGYPVDGPTRSTDSNNLKELKGLVEMFVNRPSDTPIGDVLAGLDGHTIYRVDKITRDLREAGYNGPIPGYTSHQLESQIVARGLGGYVDQTDELGAGGYQISDRVAHHITGKTGDQMGRGSRHRANVQIVREWERSVRS